MVEDVVKQDDRSKNILIFGLPEENEEDVGSAVSELFDAITEKQTAEACRVGMKQTRRSVRPTKVTTSGITIASQLLYKARGLKQVEKYRTVH